MSYSKPVVHELMRTHRVLPIPRLPLADIPAPSPDLIPTALQRSGSTSSLTESVITIAGNRTIPQPPAPAIHVAPPIFYGPAFPPTIYQEDRSPSDDPTANRFHFSPSPPVGQSDNLSLNKSLSDLAKEGSPERFPTYPYSEYEGSCSFDSCFRDIHPRFFDAEQFKRNWSSLPYMLSEHDYHVIVEPELRGSLYRIIPQTRAITRDVYRGSIFVIGQYYEPGIKYMATVRRRIGSETSLVQLNAFTENQALLRADHQRWPTLTIIVPNDKCHVPIPKELVQYFDNEFVAGHYLGGTPSPVHESRALVRYFLRSFSQFNPCAVPDGRPIVDIIH